MNDFGMRPGFLKADNDGREVCVVNRDRERGAVRANERRESMIEGKWKGDE